MESLAEFSARVLPFQTNSVPDESVFGLPSSLSTKVAPRSGELKPFYGDTVAFFLSESVQQLVGKVSEELYVRMGDSLSLPLPLEMAHVTLHDLHADTAFERIASPIAAAAEKLPELVAEAQNIEPILTSCTTAFNLMNTSVVIGLIPADETEHEKLLRARRLFDEIRPSDPFTPHITLAYYRPDAAVPIMPQKFRSVLTDLSEMVANKPVPLKPELLYALRFDSMANYWKIT